MKLELIKCHGSGNDFFIIDEMEQSFGWSDEERANLTISLCNRGSELGADGILFILASEVADAKMRVFNADGSEASMCGNGLRCVARYVCEKLKIKEATIDTMKVTLHVSKESDIYKDIPTYKVEISPVSFDVATLPLHINQHQLVNEKMEDLSEDIAFTALSVPNPHLVAIVEKEQMQSDIQEEISLYVNGENDYFPDGVNVSFVKSLPEGGVFVRTYERGVGFTNACGTAMSASSLVTCLQRINTYEQPIEVYNNGGKVRCVVHKQNDTFTIDLIGNASFVYQCTIEVDINHPGTFTVDNSEEYIEEMMQYAKLQQEASAFLTKQLNA